MTPSRPTNAPRESRLERWVALDEATAGVDNVEGCKATAGVDKVEGCEATAGVDEVEGCEAPANDKGVDDNAKGSRLHKKLRAKASMARYFWRSVATPLKTCVSGPLRCMAFTSLNW